MNFIRSSVMYDAEFSANIPATPIDAAIAGYIPGGDPARPWTTKMDWSKFAGRRKLPTFVRSDPTNSIAEDDAFQALRDLYGLNAYECLVALDIETSVDAEYVTVWGRVMDAYKYHPLVYGSRNNIFSVPPLAGRWVAAPGMHLSDFHRSQGVRIVQNHGGAGYDQSDMHEGISLDGPWWE